MFVNDLSTYDINRRAEARRPCAQLTKCESGNLGFRPETILDLRGEMPLETGKLPELIDPGLFSVNSRVSWLRTPRTAGRVGFLRSSQGVREAFRWASVRMRACGAGSVPYLGTTTTHAHDTDTACPPRRAPFPARDVR